MKPIPGILLGAGGSERFGSEKLLARLETGELLVERALRVHLQSNLSRLIFVTSPNLGATISKEPGLFSYSHMVVEKKEDHWFTFSCIWGRGRFVINENSQEGMSSSILCGLRCLKKSEKAVGALISLADLPLLSPETIDYLINEFQEETIGMLVPVFNGITGHPVIIDINRFHRDISRIKGDVGLKILMEKYSKEVRKITWSDDSVIRDIDTKSDLEKLTGASV